MGDGLSVPGNGKIDARADARIAAVKNVASGISGLDENLAPFKSNADADFVIAASTSSLYLKQRAHYICDGTDDNIIINAAIQLMTSTFVTASGLTGTSGKVRLCPGVYYLSRPVVIDRGFDFAGVTSGTTILRLNDNANCNIIELRKAASGVGLTSNRALSCIGKLELDGNSDNNAYITRHNGCTVSSAANSVVGLGGGVLAAYGYGVDDADLVGKEIHLYAEYPTNLTSGEYTITACDPVADTITVSGNATSGTAATSVTATMTSVYGCTGTDAAASVITIGIGGDNGVLALYGYEDDDERLVGKCVELEGTNCTSALYEIASCSRANDTLTLIMNASSGGAMSALRVSPDPLYGIYQYRGCQVDTRFPDIWFEGISGGGLSLGQYWNHDITKCTWEHSNGNCIDLRIERTGASSYVAPEKLRIYSNLVMQGHHHYLIGIRGRGMYINNLLAHDMVLADLQKGVAQIGGSAWDFHDLQISLALMNNDKFSMFTVNTDKIGSEIGRIVMHDLQLGLNSSVYPARFMTLTGAYAVDRCDIHDITCSKTLSFLDGFLHCLVSDDCDDWMVHHIHLPSQVSLVTASYGLYCLKGDRWCVDNLTIRHNTNTRSILLTADNDYWRISNCLFNLTGLGGISGTVNSTNLISNCIAPPETIGANTEVVVDTLIDVPAGVDNNIVTSEQLANGALSLAGQPDAPRALKVTVVNAAGATVEATVTVIGITANGRHKTTDSPETITFSVAGGATSTKYTVNPFIKITSITVSGVSGTDADETIVVGTSNYLGLSVPILSTSQVIKVTVDNVDVILPTLTTMGRIDFRSTNTPDGAKDYRFYTYRNRTV